MLRKLLVCLCLIALAACGRTAVAEFWRPINEPNLQMSPEKAQMKLEFDLSQCRCSVYPSDVLQPNLTVFQPDQQRLLETSGPTSQDDHGNCVQRPSAVVAECMRARGWEVTKCTGRMRVGNNVAICADTMIDQ